MNRYDFYCSQLRFYEKLFDNAKDQNKIIDIQMRYGYRLCFDVEWSEFSSAGCHKCKNIYSSLDFKGNFYEHDTKYPYYGTVHSFYVMCKCDLTNEQWNDPNYSSCNNIPNIDSDDEVSLEVRIDIDRSQSYLCRFFINDKENFSLVDKDNFDGNSDFAHDVHDIDASSSESDT